MPEETLPNKLPKMTRDEVRDRAQRILDLRGEPPYTAESYRYLSVDEANVLSEFVEYWLPFLKHGR